MRGMVFHIQRFSLHDGPGIRTNVFLKGCPLRCAWCHNPEGISSAPQLSYNPSRCIGCGACVFACPLGLHRVDGGGHHFDREGCTHCLACAKVCLPGALEGVGKGYTADEVLEVVLKDRPFYGLQGGMTISGGEPMAQPGFAISLAQKAKEAGIHVCVETSGFCAQSDLLKMSAYCDLFLYDIKHTDGEMHREYTGGSLDRVLDNLRALDGAGAATSLRCPIIPGVNDTISHMQGIAQIANALCHCQGIELEPYHPLGIDKRRRIGALGGFDSMEMMGEEALAPLLDHLRGSCALPVSAG